MIKRHWAKLLVFLLLLDTGYSFVQHYYMHLDGDMAESILPSGSIQKIIEDPLGLKVLLSGEVYSNPNRFFAHWPMLVYFKSIPFLLQQITTPINSIYLSCALAKIMTQLLLVFLLASYICHGLKK